MAEGKLRVFPDANFLVAAGFRPSGDYQHVLEQSPDRFVTSEHILDEVARTWNGYRRTRSVLISQPRGSILITNRFELLPPGLPLEGSGDRQALAEAIGAECDLFVTSDTDFVALFGQSVKGVIVTKSSEYAQKILVKKPS